MERTFKGWVKGLSDTERERELVTLHTRYKKLFQRKQLAYGAEKANGEISEKTAAALHNLAAEILELEGAAHTYNIKVTPIIPIMIIPELRHVFTDTTGANGSPEESKSDRQIWRGTWAGLIEQEFKLHEYEIDNGALTRRNFAKALAAGWARDNGFSLEETTTTKVLNILKYLSNTGAI